MFPINNLWKKEVREQAEKMKLPSANRPDSQGICFLGKIVIGCCPRLVPDTFPDRVVVLCRSSSSYVGILNTNTVGISI